MMHLEIGGVRVPVAAGETIIGSAPGCAILLEGEGVQPRHADLQGTAAGRGRHPCRRAGRRAAGQRVSARRRSDAGPPWRQDPDRAATRSSPWTTAARATPSSSTRRLRRSRSPSLRPTTPPPAAALSGGRLVCLTDGREYAIGSEPARLRPGCRLGRRRRRERRVTAPRGDPDVAGGLRADGHQRQRHLCERRAGRPAAPAGAGRRDPDRPRRVPVLRRCGPAAGSAASAFPPPPGWHRRCIRRPAPAPSLRHDARSCRSPTCGRP